MKIERPDWFSLAFDIDFKSKTVGELDLWFDQHVEPINKMLSEGVEIYGDHNLGNGSAPYYSFAYEQIPHSAHRAILINIEPIQKETAEDVLRDIVKAFHPDDYETDTKAFDLIHRAKAVLEQE